MKFRKILGRLTAILATTVAAAGVGYGLGPNNEIQNRAHLSYINDSSVSYDDSGFSRRRGIRRSRPADDAASSHQLSDLQIISQVIHLINENYVDPDRIVPRDMLLGILDRIEKRIPEVLVDDRDSDETDTVILTVNRTTRSINLAELNNIWEIVPRLKEAFTFIQENLVTTEDTRRIEYAAVNGMLSILDLHSSHLDPERYSDMRTQTRGEFGGVGFVISMREGRLTVMKVLPNTPAHKGGILARDIITRIEDESTFNMDLTDCVARLRGKPGTPVNIWVERADFDEPKQFTLTRAIIEIESVDQVHLLDNSIGYIRITNFQGHTTRDLRKSISKLEKDAGGKLNGLILDLRDNPGGLLEQAIQVADVFLDKGTIVSTVGMNNRLRERKSATKSSTISNLPLVVLVGNSSASASEIVGGAIKNLDRGLVIGNRTFGKGSVQILYDLLDESALKLTIAQYLTPGDISIQDKGITPDIQLLPSLVSKRRVMAFAPRRTLREQDIDSLLGETTDAPMRGSYIGLDSFDENDSKPDSDKVAPVSRIIFLRDDVPEDEEIDEFEEPEWKKDFHVEFAREILARSAAPTRREMLDNARSDIEEKQRQERLRIYNAISELGVDWSPSQKDADDNHEPGIRASLEFDGSSTAGEETHLLMTITNTGNGTLHRVRAWTETSNSRIFRQGMLFDRHEFLFGKLEAGETGKWRVPVKLPPDLTARTELIRIHVEADGINRFDPVSTSLTVKDIPKPEFEFSWQLSGTGEDPGDGRLRVGESFDLDIYVHNTGEGDAEELIAIITNEEDRHVYINRGRHRFEALEAGQSERARMSLDLKEGYTKESVHLRVSVFDRKLAEYVSDDIFIPVSREPVSAGRASGALRVNSEANIFNWADESAIPVARVPAGAFLPVDAHINSMYRIRMGDDRFGFIREDKVRSLPRSRRDTSEKISLIFNHSPPKILIDSHLSSPVTNEDEILLSGTVESSDYLRDMYIFVDNDKIFFRAWEDVKNNPADTDDSAPEKESGDKSGADTENVQLPSPSQRPGKGSSSILVLPFQVNVPLKEGTNSIHIFARKNDRLQAIHHLVFFRTPEELMEKSIQEDKKADTGNETDPDKAEPMQDAVTNPDSARE